MINENVNIDIFDNWALKDKDKGMEKGHAPSVNAMFDIIYNRTKILNSNFNFLDLGCGNGWVVRKFSNNNLCNLSVGVDGSKNMITKAKNNDSKGKYYQSNIESWNSDNQFDIVFSMETFYYLKNIDKVLDKINSKYLTDNGFMILGIDHYAENKDSLNWGNKFNLDITTLSIETWLSLFESAGFKKNDFQQVEGKESWAGTLIITGIKPQLPVIIKNNYHR